MSKVLILAAMAAVSLACHNRAEDEVGAAPEQADTTAVIADTTTITADTTGVTHVIDSTRTGPPGVGGRPGDATVTPDSVGVDSALTDQENAGTPGVSDTTMTTDTTPSWTSTPQDTLGPSDTEVYDSTTMHGDSAMTEHAVPDTTTGQ